MEHRPKLVLWVMISVAYFNTGNEQTQINQVCYFHFFGVFLASKGSNYSELIPNQISKCKYQRRESTFRVVKEALHVPTTSRSSHNHIIQLLLEFLWLSQLASVYSVSVLLSPVSLL